MDTKWIPYPVGIKSYNDLYTKLTQTHLHAKFRLHFGQVYICDCVLAILVLCGINLICIVYILQSCIDSKCVSC